MPKLKRAAGALLGILLLGLAPAACGGADEDPFAPIVKFDETPQSVTGYADMALSGVKNAFSAQNVDSPFYTDRNDNLVYTANALWRRFGNVSDGEDAVHLMGNEPTYFEWMTQKLLWSDEEATKQR